MYIVYDSEQLIKEVLKKYLPDLSDLLVVHMSVFNVRLYSAGLIPKETYEDTIMTGGRQKANTLLLSLEAKIDTQPQLMKKLIEVLKRSKISDAVAAKMEQDMLITMPKMDH